jgi:hypothetical protein
VPEANFHMLGRAMSDRSLANGGTLFTAAAQFPVAGRRTIERNRCGGITYKFCARVEMMSSAAD